MPQNKTCGDCVHSLFDLDEGEGRCQYKSCGVFKDEPACQDADFDKPIFNVGCACLKSLVEKLGWVKYKKRYTKEGRNIGNNQKFFIVETNIPRKNSPGNIGIVLNNCFICGRKIREI